MACRKLKVKPARQRKEANSMKRGGTVVDQNEKIDFLVEEIKSLKEQMNKQDEQLAYIVERLNHMREKAHAKRESEPSWPK